MKRAEFIILMALTVVAGCASGSSMDLTMRPAQEVLSAGGVVAGGFEVVRYNSDGFPDAALNDTVSLTVEEQRGLTAVHISIEDSVGMGSAIVDVHYDSTVAHPDHAKFHGLLGGEGEAISAAFLGKPGRAGLAEVAMPDHSTGDFRGELATVYFATGPARNVSYVGDVHHNPAGVSRQFLSYAPLGPNNLFADSAPQLKQAAVSWTAAWHCGDGDQNYEVNAADLVPIALHFGKRTTTDWEAAVADYDLTTEVNASDIQRIGVFFGEKTSAYEVEVADDDGLGRLFLYTVYWWDHLDPTGGEQGVLKSVFRYWEIEFTSQTLFTFADLEDIDKNQNGLVQLYVTPVTLAGYQVEQRGAESHIDIEVGEIGDLPLLYITGYDIRVEGADDGSGGNLFDGDSDTPAPAAISVADANSRISLTLNSIRGTYRGEPFSEGDLPVSVGMSQEDYDKALASARENLAWVFDHRGAPEFRRSSDWVTLDSGNPDNTPFAVTGDPGPGTVFADDDPESNGLDAEGLLRTVLPMGGEGRYFWDDSLMVQVYRDVDYSMRVDIEADEAAPEILSHSSVNLPLIINSELDIYFNWGSGGEPGSLDGLALELLPIDDVAGVPLAGTVTFTYQPGGAVNGGEFTIDLTAQPTIECIVPGASLQTGVEYAFRFFDGERWSSINKPPYLLTVGSGGLRDLLTVPEMVGHDVEYLQIFNHDPVIRRNSSFHVDLASGLVEPQDETAYLDVLKLNGDEFAAAVVPFGDPPVFSAWPLVVIGPKEGSSFPVHPGIITSPEYDGVEGIFIPLYNSNRIIVDISAITDGLPPGDADEYYAYRLFHPDWSVAGQGTFMVPADPLPVTGPTGVDWGMDVFDREVREFGDREFAIRTADASAVDSDTPQVLWVEFSDGWVYSALETAADMPYENAHLHIADREPDGWEMDLDLGIRAAGLVPGNTYLAVHVMTRSDYFDPANPGTGILQTGHTYDVWLDDDRTPELDYAFALPLLVTGELPPK